ncbi:MAG TPA: acyltransferase [Terriglobales bacterium]|jgi:acetyltransferase-like isoleucine patch superfamily enzyme|nr:acyltransferase [Terriglobales bacterium]
MSTSTMLEKKFFVHPKALVESEDIGDHTRVWAFAHVMNGARIGADCNIGDHAFVEAGVHLGNNVTVKNGVSIWQGVEVEDDVFLGPNCVFTNDPNPRAYIKKTGDSLVSTRVRTRATIGANATIVCGITIGQYAFIGAGTVVIRDVPDFAMMVGNPARQIGWMCVCATKLPTPVVPKSDSPLTCSSCGSSFALASAGKLVLKNSL